MHESSFSIEVRATPPPSSNTINLRRLNGLRLIVLAAEVLVAALALYRWQLPLPVVPMLALFAGVALLAMATVVRLRWSASVADVELFRTSRSRWAR